MNESARTRERRRSTITGTPPNRSLAGVRKPTLKRGSGSSHDGGNLEGFLEEVRTSGKVKAHVSQSNALFSPKFSEVPGNLEGFGGTEIGQMF